VAGSPPSRRESPALYRSEVGGEEGTCEIAWYGGPRSLSVARLAVLWNSVNLFATGFIAAGVGALWALPRTVHR
jgi:hypothetical protein